MVNAAAGSPLLIQQDGAVQRITLDRPAKRNALSRSLIQGLTAAFKGITEAGETRVVILRGAGPVFCAGADLTEFAADSDQTQARADANGLADLLSAMTACPVPIIARVHGAAYGGGVGLICAADIALAAEGTVFSLSEARLGLDPAVISPYVFAALGEREAKLRMLLAAPFDTAAALRSGLICQTVPTDQLGAATEAIVTTLLQSPPGALAAIKRLPALIKPADPVATRTATIQLLVDRLASDEAREGLTSFREKRPAAWVPAETTTS